MYLRQQQLVRIKDRNSQSLGRYGHIVGIDDLNCRVEVVFNDEPELTSYEPKPRWFFGWSDVEAVEGIPAARLYLLVSVLAIIEKQEQIHHILAHVGGDELVFDVAETATARFFGSLGKYDGSFYCWASSTKCTQLIEFTVITVGQYDALRHTMPDHDFGADVKSSEF